MSKNDFPAALINMASLSGNLTYVPPSLHPIPHSIPELRPSLPRRVLLLVPALHRPPTLPPRQRILLLKSIGPAHTFLLPVDPITFDHPRPSVHSEVAFDIGGGWDVVDVEDLSPQLEVPTWNEMYLVQDARKLFGGSTLNSYLRKLSIHWM